MENLSKEKPDTAPALTRGLAILQVLAENERLSLEQITKRLKVPKASAYRLLDTLYQLGMVQKGSDKRYEALWHLRPAKTALASFRATLGTKMSVLVEATGNTVEWYEPTADGMQLMLQKNPESELCVQARPGFLRDWDREFEAVTRLGHAFASQATELKTSRYYTRNGVTEWVGKRFIQRAIQAAKSELTAYDEAFNSNGVRRFAAAAFDPETNHFLGVIAIAEIYHFSRKVEAEATLQLLKTTLR